MYVIIIPIAIFHLCSFRQSGFILVPHCLTNRNNLRLQVVRSLKRMIRLHVCYVFFAIFNFMYVNLSVCRYVRSRAIRESVRILDSLCLFWPFSIRILERIWQEPAIVNCFCHILSTPVENLFLCFQEFLKLWLQQQFWRNWYIG